MNKILFAALAMATSVKSAVSLEEETRKKTQQLRPHFLEEETKKKTRHSRPHFLPEDDDWRTECAHEYYELSLYVDTQFHLLVLPMNNAKYCQEGFLLRDNRGQKTAQVLRPNQFKRKHSNQRINLRAPDLIVWDARDLLLDFFTLEDIQRAYNAAGAIHDGEDQDIVTNNFASFVLDLLKNLDTPQPKEIGDDIVDYVAGALSLHEENIKTLRSSPHLQDILLQGVSLQDHDDQLLLHLLVTSHIQSH